MRKTKSKNCTWKLLDLLWHQPTGWVHTILIRLVAGQLYLSAVHGGFETGPTGHSWTVPSRFAESLIKEKNTVWGSILWGHIYIRNTWRDTAATYIISCISQKRWFISRHHYLIHAFIIDPTVLGLSPFNPIPKVKFFRFPSQDINLLPFVRSHGSISTWVAVVWLNHVVWYFLTLVSQVPLRTIFYKIVWFRIKLSFWHHVCHHTVWILGSPIQGPPPPLKIQISKIGVSSCFKLAQIRQRAKMSWPCDFWWLWTDTQDSCFISIDRYL